MKAAAAQIFADAKPIKTDHANVLTYSFFFNLSVMCHHKVITYW